MMVWLALALAYAGLTALALGMKRHHQSLLGAKPSDARLRAFRVTGWALIALMLLCCLRLWPLGLALSLAFGLATLAGLPLIFLLPYRPRLAARLALALPLAAGVGVWVV
ncbi:DUF3325 domain-containing protein [Alloalcanivorax mobilis]|uniref:DUF3325 domain-containing protein n=1 Tax=Alloalcanivorax mobilis TaxID=2019569 RepID=UPI000B5B364E|nr:DUF3325 domain-containing protein [Alloalcanivorax mobilis]ASK33720.1 hypothetical protein CEK62_04605 [Alcanivorax sp. N3-2A]|tara:strand:- start:418 stop:747 length:330 start_codon:yes stop_codon:yes gene_type:complete